ncbi:16873_t:CDS:2 [Dentiscutata erythropus]|uniref:16873_t:CDS:1 n=1 Tax=Dentiscutata erythropus TaxID=1348616 RepID=A0A9N8VZ33_9GLOM|nr:16873_t:CDS:2 [Dentiscutata erythropus]
MSNKPPKKAIKAYEAKVHMHSADNLEAENSDDIGNLSVCNNAIENNNAASIMKRFQAAAQQYDHNSDNTDDNDDNFSAYNEPIENDNAENIETRSVLKEEKRQQQHEAAKGTPPLHTFWNQEKLQASGEELYDEQSENEDQLEKVNEEQSENEDQLEEVNEDEEDFGGLSEDEIEACNLLKKIPAALENLALDIEKENVNSEVWIRLNSIRFYLQLVKNNHQKMEASKIIADAAGKEVYHARCIRSWAHEYVMAHQIPYSCRGHHTKTWSFLWDEDILLQIKSYVQENKWNITPYMIMSQINEVLLPGLGFAPPPTISLNTAKNYLKELGYVYERVKKGVYIDGHEREDVVAYREIFLQRISELEYRMSIFSGDNMEVGTWPDSNT